MRAAVVGTAVLALASVLGGCGTSYRAIEDPPPADVLCWSHEDVAVTVLGSYADVLPNTLFTAEGSDCEPEALTPLVVVGEVVAVEKGPAWSGEEAPEGSEEDSVRVPFDDPDALWKHVHATVEVDEVLASVDGSAPRRVTVAFGLDGFEDFGSARHQLLREGRWVFPLRQWAGVDYSHGLWSVGPANTMLQARLDGRDRLDLPCVRFKEAERLLRDVPDLEALREAAARPRTTKTVEPVLIS